MVLVYGDRSKFWGLSYVYACHCLLFCNSPEIMVVPKSEDSRFLDLLLDLLDLLRRVVLGCGVVVYYGVGCCLLVQLVRSFIALDAFMRRNMA